jgi:hypothetical protein
MTLAGDTVGEVTRTFTMDDAAGERILGWAVAAYPTDADGNALTAAQSVQAAMLGVANGTVANANRHAREVAARTAAEAVGDATFIAS